MSLKERTKEQRESKKILDMVGERNTQELDTIKGYICATINISGAMREGIN